MVMVSANTSKILVVEDDCNVRTLVHRFLSRKYQIQSAANGEAALSLFKQFEPTLVILDWNLPDTSGYNLCLEMQSRTNVLVMVLSSRTDEADKLRILSAGADDYISKPFSLTEVEVRVAVLLRRIRSLTSPQTQRLVFNQLAIDLVRREVILNNKSLNLTTLEFDILYFLASYPGQAWTRTQLIQRIWGCTFVGDSRVVDVHIGQIRKKIQVDSTVPEFIKTVRGYGYKFAPPECSSDRSA